MRRGVALVRIRFALLAVMLSVALAVAGCAAAPQPRASGATVTVENCGERVTFDRVPQRVVTYFQQPTELLLALGLQDKIVGTVYPDNDPLPRYADAYRKLPLIARKDASFEQLLKQTPDLVYGGYQSAFDETAGRSRQAFADAGIKTYVDREECSTGRLTMAQLYAEIRTIAKIFRVPGRAERLIAQLRSGIEDTGRRLAGVDPLKVFVYDSGDATAYTAGGTGIGNQIIKLAGGSNVFADVRKNWVDVSWEQVLRRSPDVIVIYDYYGTPSVEEKKRLLLSSKELAEVPAIKNRRFATLTLQDAVLGVRAPYAVTALAGQLHPDRMR